MHHPNSVIDGGVNLPTSLTTSLPAITFPSNLVSHLTNSSSTASSIASLATSTNSLTNTMMMQHLPPTNICTTNPVNHTILTNVLNNVNEGTDGAPSSNQQVSSNPSTATVQISHPHNNVLSSNVIPLIVTKIEDNAVH